MTDTLQQEEMMKPGAFSPLVYIPLPVWHIVLKNLTIGNLPSLPKQQKFVMIG